MAAAERFGVRARKPSSVSRERTDTQVSHPSEAASGLVAVVVVVGGRAMTGGASMEPAFEASAKGRAGAGRR